MKNVKISSLLLAAAVTAAFSASAAEVKIVGRVDTGLVYQHNFGDSTAAKNSLSMESGPNTASRWNIRASENLTPGTRVWVNLENRFRSDDGTFRSFTSGKNARMFGGHALLGVTGKYGEIAAGRTTGISSGSGPYDFLWMTDAFGGGTWGTGNAPVKSGRYDNMLVYRSPAFSGFQATLQYSTKTDTYDDGDENTSDVNRFYGAGLAYKGDRLKAVAIYEGMDWGHKTQIAGGASQDQKLFTLGAGYKLNDRVTLYGMAQYYAGLNKLDGFRASYGASQIEGYALSAGTEFWFGPSSWKSMVYWKDYKNKGSSASYDGKTIGIGTKYVFRPSKTVEFYAGAGFSQWDRVSGGEVLTDKEVNVIAGTTLYF